MIKHIVMFRFTNIEHNNERLQNAIRMKNIFGPLKNKIDFIQYYETGINIKKTDFSYDFVITSVYKSLEDLKAYIEHPEHQKAIYLCKDIKKEKAVVDYEL
ncbi:MAG: Dabb family protein [Bacteroidales bacterium]|nr:Dabb family protein [Bacteroidales bacterium]